MKIYVTKYALTTGITAENANVDGAVAHWRTGSGWPMHAYKGEWFESSEAALENAEQRRVRKLASLRKQIEKLEKKTFKIREV
jgi:tmRNA-binding protein